MEAGRWMSAGTRMGLALLALLVTSLLTTSCAAQDSGGELLQQQAAYDVTYYDLQVEVQPSERAIAGTLVAHAVVKSPLEAFVLNLDYRLQVERAWVPSMSGEEERPVTRTDNDNQVWIDLPKMARPGDTLRVAVQYAGSPRNAPNPPWNGGFTWAETPGGAPWIATSCQTAGADLWWPVKDHPSDEPDSMDIRVTVPDTLTAASNGVLKGFQPASASTKTFHWQVSTPINPYGVALNIAPYTAIDTTYASTSGTDVPVTFYALPSDSAKARSALPQFLDHVRFLEETLGAYPFRADKYGIAQTPFKGMEHQTIIAYGNEFRLNGGLGYDAGFDALHFHELAHEWYGNCVTVGDWKDFWIHEGVATYLEALYAETLRGGSGYRAVTSYFRQRMRGGQAIARSEPTSAEDIYGTDIYFKGALVLHTLRSVIGKDALIDVLRTFMAGAADAESPTCRSVTTAEFVQTAEEVSGRQLDGFFSVYLYQEQLPAVAMNRSGNIVTLEWVQTGGAPFDVPVPVEVDGKMRRVEMDGGSGRLDVASGAEVEIDPNREVLMNADARSTP